MRVFVKKNFVLSITNKGMIEETVFVHYLQIVITQSAYALRKSGNIFRHKFR